MTFYTELNENYILKALDYSSGKPILEIKLNFVDQIAVKNILQKQY